MEFAKRRYIKVLVYYEITHEINRWKIIIFKISMTKTQWNKYASNKIIIAENESVVSQPNVIEKYNLKLVGRMPINGTKHDYYFHNFEYYLTFHHKNL